MQQRASGPICLVGFMAGLVTIALVTASAAQAADEKPPRGFLGLQYAYEETPGIRPEGRFRVRDLYPGGPAEKAGLEIGDLIAAVNGVSFRFTDELDVYNAFSWVEPGERIELSVLRDGLAFSFSLVADPEPASMTRGRPEADRKIRLYRAEQKLNELAEGDGVEVTVVRKGSSEGFRAEMAGVDPELRQDIADLIGTRYLGIFASRIKEGDRIKLHFQARPAPEPDPGSEAEPWAPPPAVKILEAPSHIWSEEPPAPNDG